MEQFVWKTCLHFPFQFQTTHDSTCILPLDGGASGRSRSASTPSTTAQAVWALEDVVRLAPGVNLRGYGHYTETYTKFDGRWLIADSTLTRLREDVFNVVISLYISDRIKRAAGTIARRLVR